MGRKRRLVQGALIGGGGLGGLGALGWVVLRVEGRLARRAVGEPTSDPPRADGRYGPDHGDELVLAVLGDSGAAGLGVHDARQTPGVLLAAGLGEASERPVRLVTTATVGAQSSDLAAQVEIVRQERPALAVIIIGANDVTHRVDPRTAVRHLAEAVRRLRDAGVEVVVGTCPDLGTVEPIPQPLRYLARRWSRRMAAAQTVAVVEAGGRTISLGDLLGPEFAARPREMFGHDRFHPSEEGYATLSAALLPSLCAALGLWPEPAPEPLAAAEVLPLGAAALAAVEAPGSEVTPVAVAGHDRGRLGRWAALRERIPRRGRHRPVLPEDVTTSGAT